MQHLDYSLDRKSTRLNSSHMSSSYAVFCLKKKNFGVVLFRDRHQLANPLFVAAQFFTDLRRLISHAVQQTIERRPVEKREVDVLAANIADQRVQILQLGFFF